MSKFTRDVGVAKGRLMDGSVVELALETIESNNACILEDNRKKID